MSDTKDESYTEKDDDDAEGETGIEVIGETPEEIPVSVAKECCQKLLSYFEQLSDFDNSDGINYTTKIQQILETRL